MAPAERRAPAISAVVCTHNRSRLLVDVLDTLAAQDLAPAEFEVLIVDNASSDDTPAVAREIAGRNPNFRYVHEPQTGLSHARNRGWREARGEYVAYLDDDCRTPTHYLSVAVEIAGRMRPAFFGGPVLPFYDGPKPGWYKDAYVAYELSPTARTLAANEFVFGGNLVGRRAILERLEGFSPRFGMRGDQLGYGEEIVPQQRLRAELPDEIVYYDPRLYIHHLTRTEKMTLRWGMRNAFARGVYLERLFHGDRPVPPRPELRRRMLRTAVALARDLLAGLVRRDRRRYPYLANHVHERSFEYVTELGRMRERYRRAEAAP